MIVKSCDPRIITDQFRHKYSVKKGIHIIYIQDQKISFYLE